MQFVRAGGALLLPGGHQRVPHLFIILTDPEPADGKVAVVMLVTERDHTEKTVVLDVGDHPFIRHRTSVNYGSAILVPAAKLDSALARNAAKLQADVGKTVLARIRAGLIASSFTPNYVSAFCRERFPDDLPDLN